MIHYLADSTAVWRLQRDQKRSGLWAPEVPDGTIGSYAPQRTEFLQSARNLDEHDRMTDMFAYLYPDLAVPKSTWRWIESAQYRLAQRGQHQSLSTVDWLVYATAAQRVRAPELNAGSWKESR